jgi:methylthioribose-1-phosphate isomerase
MRVDGRPFRTIWSPEPECVDIIDQTRLPHRFETRRLVTLQDAATAIADMQVRGAPLIGVTAAYGVALGLKRDASDATLDEICATLRATRPTAVNLQWALDRVRSRLTPLPPSRRLSAAWDLAALMADEDAAICEAIGDHGVSLIAEIARRKPGQLATVDWGTATAPIYKAHEAGLPVHVFVDETRPRNQGAALTAWELGHHGVPHTIVVDNAGGHLMQHGMVDLVIVGTDRTTAQGDVCNKIGTYLKALAARDNGIPFYVAAPSSSIDFRIRNGLDEIEIEQRGAHEVTHMSGETSDGGIETVRITPASSPVMNFAFDVTPARFVSGLVTERGIVAANAEALAAAFPERL